MKFFKRNENHGADPNTLAGEKRRLQNGSYAMIMTAIVIAVIVVVNYIVGAIPSKFTVFDVSEQKLYTIGDTTKNLLDTLEDDVTLYYLTVSGQEDTYVEKLLETYEGYSDKVDVEKINVVQQPTFAQQYTDASLTLNSVIAVSGEKSKVIDYNDIYAYDYSSYYNYSSSFDGEGQITSAINYLTGTSESKIYYTTGHNEISISSDMLDTISKANMDTAEVNLLTEEIPEDCSALIIFAPTTDLTEEEANKVIYYLQNGGHAMLVSLSGLISGVETPNFDSILEAYGVTRKSGLVLEESTNYYVSAPYFTIPTVNTYTEITSGLDNTNILLALPEAVEAADTDDASYTISTLLTSSDSSYIKTDLSNTVEKEDGDETGSFALAVAVEESFTETDDGEADVELTDEELAELSGEEADSVEEDASEAGENSEEESDEGEVTETKATKLVYYSSPALFSQEALSSLVGMQTSVPDGNQTLFAQTITYLTDREVTVSVPAKEMSTPMLDEGEMSDGFAHTMGNIAMFLLPALVLFGGIWIWMRRRAR